MSDADDMKVRAETVAAPRLVSGLDGRGWAAHVRRHPGCTLPPGAATLLVTYYRARLLRLERWADHASDCPGHWESRERGNTQPCTCGLTTELSGLTMELGE